MGVEKTKFFEGKGPMTRTKATVTAPLAGVEGKIKVGHAHRTGWAFDGGVLRDEVLNRRPKCGHLHLALPCCDSLYLKAIRHHIVLPQLFQ